MKAQNGAMMEGRERSQWRPGSSKWSDGSDPDPDPGAVLFMPMLSCKRLINYGHSDRPST
jgi:hypothetical protein